MKLKGTGDTETFLDEAARQTKSSLNLYLSFEALTCLLFFQMSACRCLKRTEQDGDGCHHTAAEGEDDTAGHVGAVGGFNGDIEIECIQDPGRTEKRGQD